MDLFLPFTAYNENILPKHLPGLAQLYCRGKLFRETDRGLRKSNSQYIFQFGVLVSEILAQPGFFSLYSMDFR